MKPQRLATVKATGERYFVQQVAYGENVVVYCCGEVVSCSWERNTGRVVRIRYEGSKKFLLDAVVLTEVVPNPQLMRELHAQGAEAKQRAGWGVRQTRGGNYQLTPPWMVKQS